MYRTILITLTLLSQNCIRYEVRSPITKPIRDLTILDNGQQKLVDEIASIRRTPDIEITDSLYEVSVKSIWRGPGETRKISEIYTHKRLWSPVLIPYGIIGTTIAVAASIVISPIALINDGAKGFGEAFYDGSGCGPRGFWVGATYNSIGIFNDDGDLFRLCGMEQAREESSVTRGDSLTSETSGSAENLYLEAEFRVNNDTKRKRYPFSMGIDGDIANNSLIDVFVALATEKYDISDLTIRLMHGERKLHELVLPPGVVAAHMKSYRLANLAQIAMNAGLTEKALDNYLQAYAQIIDLRSEEYIWERLLDTLKKSKRAYSSLTMPNFDLYPRDRFDPGPEIEITGGIVSPSVYQLVRLYPLDLRIWYYIGQNSNGGGAFSDRVQKLSLVIATRK